MAQYTPRTKTAPATQQQQQVRAIGATARSEGGGGGSEVSKAVGYSATVSDRIYAISSDPSASSVADSMPRAVNVANTGTTPVMLMVGYSSYTTDTAIDETDYLHVLLPPGETYSPPVRAVLSSVGDKTIMFGASVTNEAPDSDEYTDSTAD